MQYGEFVRLVRMAEQASTKDSVAYRRGVAALAAAGYAWLAACGAGVLAALWWLALMLHDARPGPALAAGALAVVLLWNCRPALGSRIDLPEGLRLHPDDAQPLFEALERLREKVDGPRIHEVVLDTGLDARVVQRARWGLLGGQRNFLVLGLPLLMALDRRRLLALLAHEYGHLRHGHGRFGAWVYRTRASWTHMVEAVAGKGPAAVLLTCGALAWYFPRFVARSFPLARQDEYEADRISAAVVGSDVAGAALTEIAVKAEWLEHQFWPGHWALAAEHAAPVGPYVRLNKLLSLALPENFAVHALRQALARASGFDDTHPALRERLQALQQPARVPWWSRHSALELLGERAQQYVQHLDHQWCHAHAAEWKQHHAALSRVRARIAQLLVRRDKDADAWTELGDLQRRLRHEASVRSCYDEALALARNHGKAWQGLYACLPAEDVQARLACLERLHAASAEHRWWAAQQAVAILQEHPGHDGAPHAWQARLREAEGAEARAWSELTQQPFLANTAAPDLGEFERQELEAELARWSDVLRAWLLRRPLREFPRRRCYLLVVDVPKLDREQALQLCRALEPCLWLPGPVLLLWRGESPELEAVAAAPPLYEASPPT